MREARVKIELAAGSAGLSAATVVSGYAKVTSELNSMFPMNRGKSRLKRVTVGRTYKCPDLAQRREVLDCYVGDVFGSGRLVEAIGKSQRPEVKTFTHQFLLVYQARETVADRQDRRGADYMSILQRNSAAEAFEWTPGDISDIFVRRTVWVVPSTVRPGRLPLV